MGFATIVRALDREADWWAVRRLLVDGWGLSRLGRGWDIRHWDGWRYHNDTPLPVARLAELVGLAVDVSGSCVAAVHSESPAEAFLEIHGSAPGTVCQLLDWAAEHLAGLGDDGKRRLLVWAVDSDTALQRVLASRGYAPHVGTALHRARALDGGHPLPARGRPRRTEGYRIRTTAIGPADAGRMAALLNASFRTTIHTPWSYRTFMERSPSFDARLNLVAVGSDGHFAAHVGATFDALNRNGIIEPVCTHPGDRRKGLARSLLLDALRHLERLGAVSASLDAGESDAANALYTGCGFDVVATSRPWSAQV